ncbi:hypothetical protein GO011_17220 [Mycobacterium sp. 20091114027_K0903767]|nr:hypothetical protein [Mycobacterium sp. 20091114027_K0903767]
MIHTKRARATIEPGADPGSFVAVISTEAVDRDGDSLPVAKWLLPDRVPVNINHSNDVADIVGSGAPFIKDGELRMNATFADTEEAQHIRSLVTGGHLRGCSVEYLTHEDGTHELVGVGLVNVPANPEAKVLSAKGLEPEVPRWFLDRLTQLLSGNAADDGAHKAVALRLRLKAARA